MEQIRDTLICSMLPSCVSSCVRSGYVIMGQVLVALPGKLPFWFQVCCEAVLSRHAEHNDQAPCCAFLDITSPCALHCCVAMFQHNPWPVCLDMHFVVCQVSSYPLCIRLNGEWYMVEQNIIYQNMLYVVPV